MEKRILLSSVFGPYGVDDAWGRKENIMELFHNQVTKAQGPASLRFHHSSFGLYFLAENVESPVQVLDFPSRKQFIRRLKKEKFDLIGISFIAPNFRKAQEMARLVREIQPQAEIVLGGHGAAIEGVKDLIPCDHVVQGEGIRWLRTFLGENPDRPVRHPSLPASGMKKVFGIPLGGNGGVLVPGVGCINGCRFCCTSHFFGKNYTPFFSSGAELFQLAQRISADLGSNDFFIMDENFLKNPERAHELLQLMEQHHRPFQFGIFSSAEAIHRFGVENMVRLGVEFVWMGAESKKETYEKNQGLDLKAIIRELRDHGISVLASGILFLEHHTPENIREDIEFMIELEPDLTQFMMFTPLPVTALYQEYKSKGLIDFDLPLEEWHGQHTLNWRHAHFTVSQARKILQEAFQEEFDRLSASVLRMSQTALRGYETLEAAATSDPWMALRREQLKARAERYRLLLPTLARYAHNPLENEQIRAFRKDCERLMGPLSLRNQLKSWLGRGLSEIETLRAKLTGNMPQPKTRLSRYRWPKAIAQA